VFAPKSAKTQTKPGVNSREWRGHSVSAGPESPEAGLASLPPWSLSRLSIYPSQRPTLQIGEVNHPREKEAERIAEEMTRAPSSKVFASGGGLDGEPHNTTRSAAEESASEAPPIVDEVLRSSGHRLDSRMLDSFHSRFGHDFSEVRVHTDANSAAAARAVNALAFTVGRQIVFGAGQFNAHSVAGRRLLAHELAHVVQQDGCGRRVLARQTVEQYETSATSLDVALAGKWAGRSYWEQKVGDVFALSVDNRMSKDAEERDAVLSVLWQIRPTAAVASTTTKVVTIPKRQAAAASKDLLYQITFTPRAKPRDKDSAEARFISEGPSATTVAATPPAAGFTAQQPAFTHIGFPNNDIDKFWKGHPEEKDQVFNWIQTTASASFDQTVTTSVAKKTTTQSSSFHVKGSKDASNNITSLTIEFLGNVAPTTEAAPTDYASHDFADFAIEEAQTKADPAKKDKLGALNGISTAPAGEQLSVKYAIWQYFKGGTRNAEVDAIVPIANTQKKVLYTFRFQAPANDVEIQRIGEEGTDVSLAPQGSLERVNGLSAHSKDVPALTAWLKTRYPGVTPSGTTVDDIKKSVTAAIQANGGSVAWYQNNYGITILDSTAAQTRLQSAHQLAAQQTADLRNFTSSELPILELALETMSDALVMTLKGLQMARQKARIIATGDKRTPFAPKPSETGVTLTNGSDRTIVIFDAASANAGDLFLGGGTGPGGKPAVEVETAMTYAHEIGHTIADLPGVRAKFDAFVKANNIKPMTWYAASNPPSELFPEAFALYQSDPEWLKTNWPALFNWFDALSKTGKAP
jgi:hypothetical protein